jgi:hypothetical protein
MSNRTSITSPRVYGYTLARRYARAIPAKPRRHGGIGRCNECKASSCKQRRVDGVKAVALLLSNAAERES